MRTIKQLLELTLEYFTNNDCPGLCYAIKEMHKTEMIITDEEFNMLHHFIGFQRPRKGKYFDRNYIGSDLYWNPRDINIRIKWLKHLINKL